MSANHYNGEMYAFMEKVLTTIGARESCSDNERRLGRLLEERWEAPCDEVRSEAFRCNPSAFLGVLPFMVLFYTVGLALYWMGFAFLSLVVSGVGAAVYVLEVVLYREVADRYFPEREGHNVVGVIAPRGEVRRRVVVSAHQDSAYEFNLWLFFKTASLPIMVGASAGVLLLPVAALIRMLAGFGDAGDAGIFVGAGIVCSALYPLVALFVFFHTYNPVPGAMDDLAGISVLDGLAHGLGAARSGEGFFPEHTEIVLLATSSEEAGLRGARRFAARHREELHATPTFGLFIDGIYDERFLTVVNRELSTGARHDPELVSMAQSVAASRGWPIRTQPIPLGASDATAFALAGISTVALLCQDISTLVPHYHTRHDTLEKVRTESLGVMRQLLLDMIERLDGEA